MRLGLGLGVASGGKVGGGGAPFVPPAAPPVTGESAIYMSRQVLPTGNPADSAPVFSVFDRSGNGNTLNSADGGTYSKTGGPNGLPAIVIPGTGSSGFTTGAISADLSTGFTLVMVVKLGGTDGSVFCIGDGTAGEQSVGFTLEITGGQLSFRDSTNADYFDTFDTVGDGNYHILILTVDPVNGVSFFIDGGSIVSSNPLQGPYAVPNEGWTIGTGNGFAFFPPGPNSAQMSIFEAVVHPFVFNSTQVASDGQWYAGIGTGAPQTGLSWASQFPASTSGMVAGGQWSALVPYQGSDYTHAEGKNSSYLLRLTLAGTADITARYIANNAAGLWLYINGVKTTPTLDTSLNWTSLAIGTLVAGVYDIEIQSSNAGFLALDFNNLLQSSNGGTVSFSPGFGGFLFTLTTSLPSYVRAEGGPPFNNLDGYSNGMLGTSWPLMTIGFKTTGNSFKVWVVKNHTRMIIDSGGVLGTLTGEIDNSAAYGWMDVTSPANGTSSVVQNLSVGGVNNNIQAIVQIAGSGILDASWSPPTRSQLAVYGDSITAGNATPEGACNNWSLLLAIAKGYACVNRGIEGTTVSSTVSGATSGQSRTADITGLAIAPTIVFVLYGSNDEGNGGVPQATFQAAYQAMMDALTTGLPTVPFICQYPIPRGDKTYAQMATYATAIPAAILLLTAPQQAQISVDDTSMWNFAGVPWTTGGAFDATNYEPDVLHPNSIGNPIIATLDAHWV